MSKYTHKNNMPIARVIHVSVYSLKENQTCLLHVAKTITTRDGHYYYHTNCGKNIDSVSFAHTVALDNATYSEGEGVDTAVAFCPHCGTSKEITAVFNKSREYDKAERDRENNERISADIENKREFTELLATLDEELATCGIKRKLSRKDSTWASYTIRNKTGTYIIKLSIERVEK